MPAESACDDDMALVEPDRSIFPLPSLGADIVVGNDVWIGRGARILSGVYIGHGAVVGAGAVVTHDVPDYMIVAGNPARAVRLRFEPEVVDQLLAIAWWQWSDEAIIDAADKLSTSDIAAFLTAFSPTNRG